MNNDSSTATARLLWAACRPVPDRDAVVDAVQSGADLGHAVRIAQAQRVGPLLWVGLQDAGVADQVGPERDRLKREYESRRAQAPLLLPLAAAAVLEPLTAAGLEPVVFKGPAVAMRYPEPGLRPMDDIDVLLPVGYRRGLVALQEAGWEVWHGHEGPQYDTVLYHARVPHLPLELHHNLDLLRRRPNHLTATDLWRLRQPFDCFGTPAFGLPPEEELVALAAHAGKPYHQFQRLLWSVDLAVVIGAAGTTLDWDRVARMAQRYACTTVLAVGLRHARRLGAHVPDELVALPSSPTRAVALAPLVAETWPLVADDVDMHRGLRFVLPDAWRRRVVLALGEVTQEGVAAIPRVATGLATGAVRHLRRWRVGASNEGYAPPGSN